MTDKNIKISNCVLYEMLAKRGNLSRVGRLKNHKDIERINNSDTLDVFGMILLNALQNYLDDVRTSVSFKTVEGSKITGKLDIDNTIKNQSLSKNRVCFIVNDLVFDSELIGVIKHTIFEILHFVHDDMLKRELNSCYNLFDTYDFVNYSADKIKAYSKSQRSFKLKFLLEVCALVKEHIMYALKTGDIKGKVIKDDVILGLIFEEYIRDVVQNYISKKSVSGGSTEMSENRTFYNRLWRSSYDNRHKYDCIMWSEEFICVIDAKYKGKVPNASDVHQIEAFMYGLQSYDNMMNKNREIAGVLIYAKPDNCTFRDKGLRKQFPYSNERTWRDNIVLDLNVSNLSIVDEQLKLHLDEIYNKLISEYNKKV